MGSVLEDVLKQQQLPVPKPLGAIAMIDTGASGTVLREDLPQQLGLNPIGATAINTPSSTNVICPVYLVRIVFPNDVVVETKAIAAPLQEQPIQCLIGRDVLQQGRARIRRLHKHLHIELLEVPAQPAGLGEEQRP